MSPKILSVHSRDFKFLVISPRMFPETTNRPFKNNTLRQIDQQPAENCSEYRCMAQWYCKKPVTKEKMLSNLIAVTSTTNSNHNHLHQLHQNSRKSPPFQTPKGFISQSRRFFAQQAAPPVRIGTAGISPEGPSRAVGRVLHWDLPTGNQENPWFYRGERKKIIISGCPRCFS